MAKYKITITSSFFLFLLNLIHPFLQKFLKEFIVAFALIVSPSLIIAEEVKIYDNSYNLKYRVKGNNIYDENWNLRYRIENNKIYDKHWDLEYRVDDDKIYDREWNLIYRKDRNKIYDKNYNLQYRVGIKNR
jgi:hypothetical protein